MLGIPKERVEYFALVAEIIAGLGVIISVVYLALQVGDGNKELRAQNHHDSLALAQRALEMIIEDEQVAALYSAAKKGQTDFSDADAWRLQFFYFLQLNAWEFSYYQNRDESIPHELWLGQDGWMREEISLTPALRVAWGNMQASFAEPFRGYVNDLVYEFNATGEVPDNKPPPEKSLGPGA